MNWIVGYTDRASAQGGGQISCHVSLLSESAEAKTEYTAELARVLGVDEANGSERFEPVASTIDGRYVARVEPTSTGSYGAADLELADGAAEGLVVQIAFMPTLLEGRAQVLVSICEEGADGFRELSLTLDASGRPVLVIGSAPGAGADRFELGLPTQVVRGHWYRMLGGYEAGSAFAELMALDEPGAETISETGPLTSPLELRSPTVYFACRASSSHDGVRLGGKFTGRLEEPAVATALARDAGAALERGSSSLVDKEGLLARWDFGRDSDSFKLHDASGNGNHGRLFGLAMRSVTGSNWDPNTTSVDEAPDQYRAIHFSADAIEDAGWPAAFSLRVPAELRSGLYAFILRSEDDVETVPFVVTPPRSSRADVLLILPTATYMAYSNWRGWERLGLEIQSERTPELGRGEQILLEHPELGASSYDEYRDGTKITYVSWRRPNLDMRAAQTRGESYPRDLRLIGWLEQSDYRYDVCTDSDLDQRGVGLLASYRLAVTGTHPEYASTNCYRALESFVGTGGRLAVLGGDAYTWRVAFGTERPWIMEVRKMDGVRSGSRAAAEGRMGFTGEFTGEPQTPPPSGRLLGTSTASMGFDAPRPYERVPASDRAEVRFIFRGIPDRMIGDDTRGGGVVFQEWDNTDAVTGFAFGDNGPLVLARSSGHSINTRWFSAIKRRAHAEITFFTTSGGGAVFSAGSMGWCLCLHRRDVAAITANVLDRFLDPAPFQPVQPE